MIFQAITFVYFYNFKKKTLVPIGLVKDFELSLLLGPLNDTFLLPLLLTVQSLRSHFEEISLQTYPIVLDGQIPQLEIPDSISELVFVFRSLNLGNRIRLARGI